MTITEFLRARAANAHCVTDDTVYLNLEIRLPGDPDEKDPCGPDADQGGPGERG